MSAVAHHPQPGRQVLVVAHQPNSRLTATRSEILGMGVALQIGIRLYQVEYPYWAATPGLQAFDLVAFDQVGNEFRVEARGGLIELMLEPQFPKSMASLLLPISRKRRE